MKKYLILIIIILPGIAFSEDYWNGTPHGPGRWILAEELPYVGDFLPVHIAGGAPMSEIRAVGLSHIGAGDPYDGYFFFSGDYELVAVMRFGQEVVIKVDTYMWPPGLITPDCLIPGGLDAAEYTYMFICGCTGDDDPFPQDSVRSAHAIGYWKKYEAIPPDWPEWDGYLHKVFHPHPCKVIPCPAGGGTWDKDWIVFTDSMYNELD